MKPRRNLIHRKCALSGVRIIERLLTVFESLIPRNDVAHRTNWSYPMSRKAPTGYFSRDYVTMDL